MWRGFRLARFYERLLAAMPPERDPMLAELPLRELGYVPAGLSFYKCHLYREVGQGDSAQAFLQEFMAVVPAGRPPAGPPVRP